MQKSLFFDGQEVLHGDLNNIEITTGAELTLRTVQESAVQGVFAFVASGGPVYTPLEVWSTATPGPGYNLHVYPGYACDVNGEIIKVSTQYDLAAVGADVDKYVVAKYVAVDGTQVPHPITGALNDTRRTDSYSIYLAASPASDEVILTKITAYDAGTGLVTIDNAYRQYWGARLAPGTVYDGYLDPNGQVLTHVLSRGTGTYNASTNPHALSLVDLGDQHELLDHSAGIERVGTGGDPGKVTVDPSTNPDQLLITQTIVGDSILIPMDRISGAGKLSPTTITFADASGTNDEVYEIMVGRTGAVTKHKICSFSGSRTVTGVWIVDMDPSHAAGSFTLALFAVTTVPYYLFWNSAVGSSGIQTLDAVDGFYTLYGQDGKWIKVYVSYTELPVISGWTYVSDVVTVTAQQSFDSDHTPLAVVPWISTGVLGYGTEGSSGYAYDRRIYGNLKFDATQNTWMTLHQMIGETRAGGFINSNIGIVEAGFDITMAAPPAYIGRFRVVPSVQTKSLTPSNTNYVYFDEYGTLCASTHHPSYNVFPFADVGTFVTDGSGITSRNYTYIVLPEFDVQMPVIKCNCKGTYIGSRSVTPNSEVALSMNAKTYDTANMIPSSGYGSRITITRAGKYRLHGGGNFRSVSYTYAAGSFATLIWRINGSVYGYDIGATTGYSPLFEHPAASNFSVHLTADLEYTFNTGDYAELVVYLYGTISAAVCEFYHMSAHGIGV
jgi:hypothetical protein